MGFRKRYVIDSDRRRHCGGLDLPSANLFGILAYCGDRLHDPEEVVAHPYAFDGVAKLAVLDEEDAISRDGGEISCGIIVEPRVPEVGDVHTVPDVSEQLIK